MPVAGRAVDTVPALLADVLRADPSRPALTWLDTGSGARTELSVATLANWVAKTGGLLQDELDVAAGDRVLLSLPTHWLAVTWALGCWAVGAVVQPDDLSTTMAPEVEVFGDDRSPRTTGRPVVVGLAPFGGPARGGGRSSGALDSGAEVLGHPDHLVPYEAALPTSAALLTASAILDQRSVLASGRTAAERIGLGSGDRLLTDASPVTAAGLVEVVLAPLVVAGSVVLLTGPHDASTVDRLAGIEQPDVVRVTP